MENQEFLKGRRSSILKPPRSPVRAVLSEFNSDHGENRKSLTNKRVSFAEKFEVAIFDREASKDLESSQDKEPPNASSVLHIPQPSILGTQGVPWTQQNCVQSDSFSLNGTKYFHDGLCDMSDITRRKSSDFCMETDLQNQHNITDNALEDMSLTLPLAAAPSAASDVASTNLSVEEKSFSKVNFSLDVHGLSQESIQAIRVDSTDRPLFGGDESHVGLTILGVYPSENSQLQLSDEVNPDENGIGILDVSRFFSPGDLSMDCESDGLKEMVYQKPEVCEMSLDCLTPAPIFLCSEMVERCEDTTTGSHRLRRSAETIYMTESMALTLSDVAQKEFLVAIPPVDDLEHKTINLSQSMDIDSIDSRSDEEIWQKDDAFASGLDIASTKTPMYILANIDDTQNSPPRQNLLPDEGNLRPKVREIDMSLTETVVNQVEISDAFESVPFSEAHISTGNSGSRPGVNQCPAVPDVQVNCENSLQSDQPVLAPVVPFPKAGISNQVPNSSPFVNALPVGPKIQTNSVAKGAAKPGAFSFLTRKMAAVKLKPTQDHVEKCKVNTKIDHWPEPPSITGTSPKDDMQILSAATDENNEILMSDVAAPGTEKPEEQQILPVEKADVIPGPLVTQKSYVSKLNTILRAQDLLKSPSRIPVRCGQAAKQSPAAFIQGRSEAEHYDVQSVNEAAETDPVRQTRELKSDDRLSDFPLKSTSVPNMHEQREAISDFRKDDDPTLETTSQNAVSCVANVIANTPKEAVLSEKRNSTTKLSVKNKTPRKASTHDGPATPQSESHRVFTTPSMRRSVTRHSCIHSSGRRSTQSKNSGTPDSEPRKQPSEKRQKVSLSHSNVRKILTQKHTITPVSETRKPNSKRLHLGDAESSLLLNENFPLVEGFSLNSELGSIAAGPQSCSVVSKDSNRVPAANSIRNPLKQNTNTVSVSCTSKLAGTKDSVRRAYISLQKTVNECLTSVAETLHSDGTNASLVPTVNYSDASPLLSDRKQDVLSVQCMSDSFSQLLIDPKRSLQEDFEHSSPTGTLDAPAPIGQKANETLVNRNYTFTRPDRVTFIFTPELDLAGEIQKLMKSELVADDWKFRVKSRSEGIVYFYYAIDVYYLSVTFGDINFEEGGARLGREMTNVKVVVKETDYSKRNLENPIALKIIEHHLPNSLENYKYSYRLPELLMSVTDAFFRGQSLKRDLYILSSYQVVPMTSNSDGATINTCLLSTCLRVQINLLFSIKFETYPFAAVRPVFSDVDNGAEFQSDIMEAMMNVKPGDFYLWRMYKEARSVLEKALATRPPVSQPPLHTILFVNCKK